MLIVVYLTNRSKKSINRKKLIIYAIYATPIFIFGLYLLFQEGIRDTEFLTIIGFFLFVPAIMIYFTKLLPPRGQIVRIESREDLIDDISDF